MKTATVDKINMITRFAKLIPLLVLPIIAGCTDKEEVENIQKKHANPEKDSHGHDHTAHLGVVAPLMAGETEVGYVELKLHDDKGDLELWLTEDETGIVPLDYSLDTVVTVTFPKLEQKAVELRIRNNEKNEDEDGKGNIREGKTNYFIFPGDTGVDASFLVGKDFVSDVVITFSVGDVKYSTAAFELKPHIH